MRKIELLAPGGDVDSIKTAILAGADAVYCGLNKFNARNRATNISFEDLQGILRLAHTNNCEVFLTLNILILDCEIPALIKLLNRLVNTSIDGVIVQDIGLFHILSEHFKSLRIHASTQFTTHNAGQINFLNKLQAERVNLSRELSLNEIRQLTATAKDNNMLTEVFVHGSYCISFSGICYMSSVNGGNSGNRGRCSQPCRDKYVTTAANKEYPLNLKDNSAYFDLKELYDANVYSVKIEGRIKEFEYVYTVVNTWRKQINSLINNNLLLNDDSDLHKVFNRDFSNAFLKANIGKDMFIDNPMSNSLKHIVEKNASASNSEIEKEQAKFQNEKEELRKDIRTRIEKYSTEKIPVNIHITGACSAPLKVTLTTPTNSHIILSDTHLTESGDVPLTEKILMKRLNAIDESEYGIKHVDYQLASELYLPFKELSLIKKRIILILNNSKKLIAPITLAKLKKHKIHVEQPKLSILISSENDIEDFSKHSKQIYFALPNSINGNVQYYHNLFTKNEHLIPWFPSILIGDDFNDAVELLRLLQPQIIATNNTGIAFEAYQQGISWIAGPHMNICNSYSLIALKEKFKCTGAFISNEISKGQLMGIKKPDNFQLHYSIYHPSVLMTSRQCLFHQTSGCEKIKMDDTCLPKCKKSTTINSLSNEKFFIHKSKGNYNTLYNHHNYLNTDVVKDFQNLFSSYLIDMRHIETETNSTINNTDLVELFSTFLQNNSETETELKQALSPTSNMQYKKGI